MLIYHCLKCEEIGVFVMTWGKARHCGTLVGLSVSAKSLII
jgi:hypothetical protein